jgi:transposase
VLEPQEIEDREDEQAATRVAAVDVAKASGVVCTRVPRDGAPGRFVTKVWPVGATTNAILELADHLTAAQIEKVVLESTSDYWRPFFYLLEAAGLHVELVNARDVKNAPGRPKTDKLDAVWLAKLAGWGMLRPSFVPPPEIRQLRDYTRLRTDLTRERTRHWQRLEKLPVDVLIKVTTVASRIDTLSVRDMVEALPSALPAVPGAKVVKALERAGFTVTRVRGSHHNMRHPDGRTVSVRSMQVRTWPRAPCTASCPVSG